VKSELVTPPRVVLDCRYQVEPDPAEMAECYGTETTVIDWHTRRLCARAAAVAGSTSWSPETERQ
jgi:hypothetical protein